MRLTRASNLLAWALSLGLLLAALPGCGPSEAAVQAAVDARLTAWKAENKAFFGDVVYTMTAWECSGNACTVLLDISMKSRREGQCSATPRTGGADFCRGSFNPGQAMSFKISMNLVAVGDTLAYEGHTVL